MGLLGGEGEEPEARVEYLWPENIAAWRVWCGVQTQWRTGMGGSTGLDYAGVRAYLKLQRVPEDEQLGIFEGVRAAETASLEVWAERRRKEDQRSQPQPLPPPAR